MIENLLLTAILLCLIWLSIAAYLAIDSLQTIVLQIRATASLLHGLKQDRRLE